MGGVWGVILDAAQLAWCLAWSTVAAMPWMAGVVAVAMLPVSFFTFEGSFYAQR